MRRVRGGGLRMALHGLVLVLLVLIAEPVWQTLAGLPLSMQVVAAASAPQGTGAEGLVLYAAPQGAGAEGLVLYAAPQGAGAEGHVGYTYVSRIELPTSGSDALAFAQTTTRIAVSLAHPTKGFTPRRVQCGIRRFGRCQVFGARGAKLRMLDT